MVEVDLKANRGGFQFEVACQFAAPWTVIFGPSGAGKSTLLRLIAGLELPDAGRICINGQYMTDTEIRLRIPPGRRMTGLVAQQPALFPHLTVIDNIAYGLAGRVDLGRQTKQQRIASVLDLVGASHLVDRTPRALSGGEAQRVALARTLAPMPRLLLLDEPLSALDAGSRDQILTSLQGWLGAETIQTILVTHDAADALATEAEVALIAEGKLTALGPARQVLSAERERLLARLNCGQSPAVKPARQSKAK
jgi:ABC-type Fe3+/spermidine/putrescine transport system ATPase subunit